VRWGGVVLTCLGIALPGEGGKGIQVLARESDRRVDVLVDGQPFTSYIWPESLTKPVLYPLRTEKGTLVTRGFPLDPRPGERTDHPHHVGLWFNYGDVDGVDFWNNSTALPKDRQAVMGRGRHVRILGAESGATEGRLRVLIEWVLPDGRVALDETTSFVFHKTPGGRIVDRSTTLAARDKPVRFPDNKEGVLGLRVARALEQPSNEPATFTDAAGVATTVAKLDNTGVTGLYHSSEGKEGDAVWGTRGRWCALSGKIGDEDVTIAILDDPKNPGAPTYWHARGYGLFAANPLGQKALSDGKETLDFALAPKASATFRHRIVILSRPFAAAEIEALWKEMTAPR
jgi:Family of unknown function (DUF6807)